MPYRFKKNCVLLNQSASLVGLRASKVHWRRKWQPTPVLLSGKSHGQRSIVGYSPWGCKESDTTEPLHFTSGRVWGLEGKKLIVFTGMDRREEQSKKSWKNKKMCVCGCVWRGKHV